MQNGGWAGGGAKAVGHPGRETRPLPGIEPYPRGYEKLSLGGNVRCMTHHSVSHTTAWVENGDVIVLLLRSGPEDPDPSEIARVCKYVLRHGRKGVGRPRIHREIWRDAVLGYDERSDAKAICTNRLNATVAM